MLSSKSANHSLMVTKVNTWITELFIVRGELVLFYGS